jgi:hypothetical protein
VTDSNRRPSRCKRDALPTELTARDRTFIWRQVVAHWLSTVNAIVGYRRLRTPAKTLAPVRPRASSSKRFCGLQVGFVPNLEFGIYFSAREQHERPHPEPEQEDDDRAQRAVGGVVRAEIRYIK